MGNFRMFNMTNFNFTSFSDELPCKCLWKWKTMRVLTYLMQHDSSKLISSRPYIPLDGQCQLGPKHFLWIRMRPFWFNAELVQWSLLHHARHFCSKDAVSRELRLQECLRVKRGHIVQQTCIPCPIKCVHTSIHSGTGSQNYVDHFIGSYLLDFLCFFENRLTCFRSELWSLSTNRKTIEIILH